MLLGDFVPCGGVLFLSFLCSVVLVCPGSWCLCLAWLLGAGSGSVLSRGGEWITVEFAPFGAALFPAGFGLFREFRSLGF